MLVLAIFAVIIGAGLLALECFIPGVGIAGITGGILSIIGIVGLVPYIGWYVVFVIMAIIVIVLLCIYFFAKTAEDGKNPLVLSQKTDKESGFSANDDNSNLLGKQGEAVTGLRPSGIALIEGNRIDVVTDGAFFEAGTKIYVSDIQGRRIIVKKIEGGN